MRVQSHSERWRVVLDEPRVFEVGSRRIEIDTVAIVRDHGEPDASALTASFGGYRLSKQHGKRLGNFGWRYVDDRPDAHALAREVADFLSLHAFGFDAALLGLGEAL